MIEENKLQQPTYLYEDMDQVNLLSCVTVLLKRRWLIVTIFLAAVLSSYVSSKLQTKQYQATATFLVAEKSFGSLMKDEQQSSSPFENPVDYYKSIAVSSLILDPLLEEKFPHPETGQAAPLLEIWQVKGDSEDGRLYNGREALEENIKLTNARNFPNIITLTVTAESPQLAADLANKTIKLLGQYDLQLKTANAKQRIHFIESQIADTETKLKTAEDRLEKFLGQNRVLFSPSPSVSTSPALPGQQFLGQNRPPSTPSLTIEKERLDREVRLLSEIFITLKKELEIARIAERKEASAISVIDKATPPRWAFKPRTRKNVALAGMMGLMLAVGLAFVREYVSSFGAESEESRKFLRTWEETKGDLRQLLFLGKRKKPEAEPSSPSRELGK